MLCCIMRYRHLVDLVADVSRYSIADAFICPERRRILRLVTLGWALGALVDAPCVFGASMIRQRVV